MHVLLLLLLFAPARTPPLPPVPPPPPALRVQPDSLPAFMWVPTRFGESVILTRYQLVRPKKGKPRYEFRGRETGPLDRLRWRSRTVRDPETLRVVTYREYFFAR